MDDSALATIRAAIPGGPEQGVIPSPADDRVAAALASLGPAGAPGFQGVVAQLTRQDVALLDTYAFRMAVAAVRTGDPRRLAHGLDALSLAMAQPGAETQGLVMLEHACRRMGWDVQRVFGEALPRLSPRFAEVVRATVAGRGLPLHRSPFFEGTDADGAFTYVYDSDRRIREVKAGKDLPPFY